MVLALIHQNETPDARRARYVDNINAHWREAGFTYIQRVAWIKSTGLGPRRAATAWKGRRLVNNPEYILVFQTPEE